MPMKHYHKEKSIFHESEYNTQKEQINKSIEEGGMRFDELKQQGY